MARKSRIILAALAAVATLGAVQMVASQSASTATLADRFEALSESSVSAGINRAAKGDRDAAPQGVLPARTVLLRPDGVAPNISVLVRIPLQKDAGNLPAAPSAKPAAAKMTVACEPPVSLLTDVAKLLQPGRCVT